MFERATMMALVPFTFWCSISSAATEEINAAALISNTRQLTFEGRRAGEGYFSADGSKMVFQSEREPDNPFYQIYLLDLITGDVQRVSPGWGKTTCAWIHPSNERVLYASSHADPEARDKMKAELEFRASGKRRRYAWDYDPEFDIYLEDLNNGQRKNLTEARGYDAEGAFSPDGTRIVFASNRRAYAGEMTEKEAAIFEHDKSFMMDLYLMDADGSNVRRLTDAPGYDGGPFFSFDGGMITWRRFSADGATAEIYTMDFDHGVEKQITRMGVMSWAPFFHPSGDYLIFASNREGFANFELFIVDAEGRHDPVRVTHTDGFDGLPVFTPDGRQLSWTSNRTSSKQSQIFIADWDDAEGRRLLGLDQAKAGVAPQTHSTSVQSPILAEDVRVHVERLTADEMAGRLTGSPGERRATAYVASVFEHLGLQPGGDEGTFFQSFPFTAGVRLGPDNQLTITDASFETRTELHTNWRPLALSRAGPIESTGVVFAGYGIVAPGSDKVPDYDSYGEVDVEGKWVMVLRFQPESVPPEWRRHLVHYSDLPYKAAVAKRNGAVGIIVATGPNAEARDRLVALKSDTISANAFLGGIAIGDNLASELVQLAGKELEALQNALDNGDQVAGFTIPNVMISATIDIVREKRTARNVIAILDAGAKANKAPVMLGAHVDHLGRGEISGSLARHEEHGAIHHGADDNASGVAALLSAAQYLSALHKQGKLDAHREIWFIAWSGEELGTLGSTYFVETLSGNANLGDEVAAYLNMDMVGHLRGTTYLQGTGSSGVWVREIERNNVSIGLSIATKSDPYLPTDSTPFYLKGVPVLNAFTGAHEDYSTPRDTADKLNDDGIRDIAWLMSNLTLSVARAEQAPEYLKIARDKGGLSRKHLRAYLGTIPSYGQDESVAGVKLQGAVKDAPADKAGIEEGDILVALAGVEIRTIHDFMSALSGLKPGEATEMIVLREGDRVSLEVVPTSRE